MVGRGGLEVVLVGGRGNRSLSTLYVYDFLAFCYLHDCAIVFGFPLGSCLRAPGALLSLREHPGDVTTLVGVREVTSSPSPTFCEQGVNVCASGCGRVRSIGKAESDEVRRCRLGSPRGGVDWGVVPDCRFCLMF